MVEVEFLEVDFGVANTYKTDKGFKIELNPKLKEFPDLLAKVKAHEIEHTQQKSWMGQRKVDALTSVKFSDLYPFFKKYPKTLLQQYSPISYKDKTILIEWSLCMLYSFYLLLGVGIFFLIKTFSSDSQMFWQIVKWIVILLIGIFGLYQLGKYLRNQVNKEASEIKDKPTMISKLEALK